MVYDRDAKLIFEYAKGDPYIADMTHTSGHVGPSGPNPTPSFRVSCLCGAHA